VSRDADPPAVDAPLDWGVAPDMNALEVLMWRAEADPRLRSTICALEILDRAPEWDRFLAAHDWASRMVPRFRKRVVEPVLGLGQPTWVVDADFALSYHVRRVRLPGDATFSTLLEMAAQLAMTPFDKARSPWEAVLYEGLPDGRAAYVLKLHHSSTDGIGAVQLLSQLHSSTSESRANRPEPPAPEPERPSQVGLVARQAQREAGGALNMLRHAAGRLQRPDRAVRGALRFGDSLRRVLADPAAEGSPLLRGRSLTWHFLAFDVAFADLRAAGKAAGGSLNDAFLAALLGGFRRYHEELGAPVAAIPMAIPISVRTESDAVGGNRFAAARLAGPVEIADPAQRIRAIGAIIRAAREEPALEGIGFLAPALSRLPGPVISQIAGGVTKANDLQASNVPGMREDVFLAGARIERLYPFGPLPGAATMITLVTHGQLCCIGVNLDPAAVTEPDRFGRCLWEGFAEVLALHPGAADPVHRT
jgi:WS/DGAT/MGAT family acyltransferase